MSLEENYSRYDAGFFPFGSNGTSLAFNNTPEPEKTVELSFASDEGRRQAELVRLEILDTPAEPSFDLQAKILAASCGCSSAWISFFGPDLEWAKASTGVVERSLPRAAGFSRFVLGSPSVSLLRFPKVEISPIGEPLAFYAAAPIRANDTIIGSVAVMDSKPRDLLSNQALSLTLIADHVQNLLEDRLRVKQFQNDLESRGVHQSLIADAVSRIENANYDLHARSLELSLANARLQALAETDSLTGLRNRRGLFDEIQSRIGQCQSMALVFIDLDNFKIYNDTYGHLAGDEALRILSGLISSSVRGADIAARYGGEEFVLLLTDVSCQHALDIADRLRRQVESYPWPNCPITISAGVSVLSSKESDAETLVQRADSALFAAKRLGKNAVLAHVASDLEG